MRDDWLRSGYRFITSGVSSMPLKWMKTFHKFVFKSLRCIEYSVISTVFYNLGWRGGGEWTGRKCLWHWTCFNNNNNNNNKTTPFILGIIALSFSQRILCENPIIIYVTINTTTMIIKSVAPVAATLISIDDTICTTAERLDESSRHAVRQIDTHNNTVMWEWI